MKSKISILDFYLTARYDKVKYSIVIDTDEKTLSFCSVDKEIDITSEFDEFMVRLEGKYLK